MFSFFIAGVTAATSSLFTEVQQQSLQSSCCEQGLLLPQYLEIRSVDKICITLRWSLQPVITGCTSYHPYQEKMDGPQIAMEDPQVCIVVGSGVS